MQCLNPGRGDGSAASGSACCDHAPGRSFAGATCIVVRRFQRPYRGLGCLLRIFTHGSRRGLFSGAAPAAKNCIRPHWPCADGAQDGGLTALTIHTQPPSTFSVHDWPTICRSIPTSGMGAVSSVAVQAPALPRTLVRLTARAKYSRRSSYDQYDGFSWASV
jgi:hypothetical protein